MALEDWLSAAGAGLGGALQAYSWQKEREDTRRQVDTRSRQADDELQLRREQLKADIQRMLDSVASDKADRNEKAAAAKAKAQSDKETRAAQDAYISGLPPHLQAATRARQLNLGAFDPEDFQAPKTTKELAAEREAALAQIEAEAYRRAQGTRRGNPPARDTPVTPAVPKDDPALPAGVRKYIASLKGRYPNQQKGETFISGREGARQELVGAIEDLYRDHPNLDTGKMFQMFDSIFPEDDFSVSPAGAASDTGAGTLPITQPQPQPGVQSPGGQPAAGGARGRTPVTAASQTRGGLPVTRGRGASPTPSPALARSQGGDPDLKQTIADLVAQYDATTDPNQQATLRELIARLMAQADRR